MGATLEIGGGGEEARAGHPAGTVEQTKKGGRRRTKTVAGQIPDNERGPRPADLGIAHKKEGGPEREAIVAVICTEKPVPARGGSDPGLENERGGGAGRLAGAGEPGSGGVRRPRQLPGPAEGRAGQAQGLADRTGQGQSAGISAGVPQGGAFARPGRRAGPAQGGTGRAGQAQGMM
jgi:hypothetical protein